MNIVGTLISLSKFVNSLRIGRERRRIIIRRVYLTSMCVEVSMMCVKKEGKRKNNNNNHNKKTKKKEKKNKKKKKSVALLYVCITSLHYVFILYKLTLNIVSFYSFFVCVYKSPLCMCSA